MAATEVEEPSQPLQTYKTWVLKVSIHCEGCKRKVKKILQSLPGVHGVDIETRLQRVVVTGEVSPETLIKKLLKARKHAELWPEKADKKPANVHPPDIYNQKTEKATSNEGSSAPVKESKPPAKKPEIHFQHSPEAVTGGGGKVEEVVRVGKSEVKVAGEVKAEEKKPETGSAGNQGSQSVVGKNEDQNDKTAGVPDGSAGGGEAKKERKKKGQNSNKKNIGETSSGGAPPVIGGSPNHGDGGGPPATTLPSYQSPPRHNHGYQYLPAHYYTPSPAPVHAVSYNTAHPPLNNTASSYAAPPPYSYVYSHSGSDMDPLPPPPPYRPPDFDSYTHHRSSDSFEMFSDENPNGCLVM